jgi:hypothetical protein
MRLGGPTGLRPRMCERLKAPTSHSICRQSHTQRANRAFEMFKTEGGLREISTIAGSRPHPPH